MKFISLKRKVTKEQSFNSKDFIILNYEQLLKVNGAKGGGQSSPSDTSNNNNAWGPSNPSSNPTSSPTANNSSNNTSTQPVTPKPPVTPAPVETKDHYVDNSNEGIAGAQVGDKIVRNDGTVITLNQGDINYAKNQLEKDTSSNSSTTTTPSQKIPDTTVPTPIPENNNNNIVDNSNSDSSSTSSSKDPWGPSNPNSNLNSSHTANNSTDTNNSVVDNSNSDSSSNSSANDAWGHSIPDTNHNSSHTANNLNDKSSSVTPEQEKAFEDNFDKTLKKASDEKEGKDMYEKLNMCDGFVEDQLKKNDVDPTKYLAGPAYNTDVETHIKKNPNKEITITAKKKEAPKLEEGLYIVMMDQCTLLDADGKPLDDHCGMLQVKDGQFYLTDNSSGNYPISGTEDCAGGVDQAKYDTLQQFQTEYAYKYFYYVPVDYQPDPKY